MSAIKANLQKLKKAQENAAKLPVLADALALVRARWAEWKCTADDNSNADWDSAIAQAEREVLFLKQQKQLYVKVLEAEAHARQMAADADAKRDPTAVYIPKYIQTLYAAPAPLPGVDGKDAAAYFRAEDLKAVQSFHAATTAHAAPADFDGADFRTRVRAFGTAMADESISADAWAAAIVADDYRLVHVLAYAVAGGVLSGTSDAPAAAEDDALLTELLNNLAMLSTIAPAHILPRVSVVPGIFSRFSLQFESATDQLLEMRLRFFLQLCLAHTPAATTEFEIAGAADVANRLLDLLDHEMELCVDSAAYALLLLNGIDGKRAVLHTCNEHKNRQQLMEQSYRLINRALHDAKVELTDDERQKLEWSALTWQEHVQKAHPVYFYANDLRVLLDALIRLCTDSGLVAQLPEYLRAVSALLRLDAAYPKEPTDDRCDYKVSAISRCINALGDNAASAKPQTDLILDISKCVKMTAELLAPKLDHVLRITGAANGHGGAAAAAGARAGPPVTPQKPAALAAAAGAAQSWTPPPPPATKK